MNKGYHKKRHHQLLKYSENLRKQGKFIEKESPESDWELLTYSAMVYSQLNWDIKDQYLEIFKKFLLNRITSARFCELLQEKRELNNKLADKLQYDIIHEKATNFTDFLGDVSISYEVCDRNPASCRSPGDISESELRNEIEEVYLKIQKLLEE
uniref:Uncharacterized protein n=1 Tax=Cylindrotheca closterium TaxID=2856 RepID=A0A023HBN4_9STRA|nr:hypothetical protein [Cylindrotheca closterium]AGH28543.1 hypothetical protein [Cylindrotheca closterium]